MDNQILAHTKYNCTYHIVFIPKYRRKVMYGKIGKEVGEILSTVCKITGVELIKGGVCPKPCASVCFDSAQDEYLRSDVKIEGKECADDIRSTPGVQGQVWQTFLGKGVLCRNDRASERRNNQKVHRRAGRVQQDRRIKSLF